LENNKRVIPVLVGGAVMPRADALPEAIRPLARRNALALPPDRFRADCQGLITALKEQLAAAARERAPRTGAERAAAEALRCAAEAQAAARGWRLGNLSAPKSVQKLQTALHAKAKAEAGTDTLRESTYFGFSFLTSRHGLKRMRRF
jgi:hypothetical protein